MMSTVPCSMSGIASVLWGMICGVTVRPCCLKEPFLMARKSGASSTMGSAPTVRWVFSSPVPVLEVLVLGWADPPQAAVAHNVANPAATMQAVLRRGNIMTLLAGHNSQRGVNHTCVVLGGPRACPPRVAEHQH